MDTSEEYCKMCDCPEIQGQRKFDDGDVVYLSAENPQEGRGVWICGEWEHGSILHLNDDGCFISWDGAYNWDVIQEAHAAFVIWLPRQDQLIKMIEPLEWMLICGGKEEYLAKLVVKEKIMVTHCYGPSPEQTLLELFMIEVHQKKWTGEVWE